MAAKKIVFLGSKPVGYQCLLWILDEQQKLDAEVIAILTNERREFGSGHNINELAGDRNIPVFSSPDEIPECDIIYSVQYHQILRQAHIDKAKQLAVNLHMAPLPEYRGSNQFSFAIIEGKEEFGTTLHKIDTRIDHGDILFQKRFPIPENCWVDDLYKLTVDASVNLFRQTLPHIILGNYQPVSQQLLEAKYGTSLHYRKEMSSLKEINLNWDKQKIERHIRATSMPGFEPPYCLLNGEKIHFTRNGQ
jgi:methionyl-tRNA formyltransferase